MTHGHLDPIDLITGVLFIATVIGCIIGILASIDSDDIPEDL